MLVLSIVYICETHVTYQKVKGQNSQKSIVGKKSMAPPPLNLCITIMQNLYNLYYIQ